jgi:hypothetical protein
MAQAHTLFNRTLTLQTPTAHFIFNPGIGDVAEVVVEAHARPWPGVVTLVDDKGDTVISFGQAGRSQLVLRAGTYSVVGAVGVRLLVRELPPAQSPPVHERAIKPLGRA